jgi:hypothetical protein
MPGPPTLPGAFGPQLGALTSGKTFYRPAANGDTLNDVGSSLETIARPNQSPSPEPTATVPATIKQTTVVATGKTFAGQSNLTDYQESEADTLLSPLRTITTKSDNYFRFVKTMTGQNFQEIGFSSTDSYGVKITLVYGAGNGLVDELPELGGQAWTNDAALTETELDPDGQSSTRTVHADGTYTETVNFPGGYTSSVSESADTSGTYRVHRFGSAYNGDFVYNYATPNPSGSGGPTITITNIRPAPFASPGATASPTPLPTILYTVKDWYPNHLGPFTFAKETDADNGFTPLASTCDDDVVSRSGNSGNKIVQTKSRLDTIFGELEAETVTTWVQKNVGPACVQINDTVTDYYDLSGQNAQNYFTSAPIQITSFNETVSLESEILHDLSSAQTASRHGFAQNAEQSTQANFALRVALAEARVASRVFQHHVEHVRQMMQNLQRYGTLQTRGISR